MGIICKIFGHKMSEEYIEAVGPIEMITHHILDPSSLEIVEGEFRRIDCLRCDHVERWTIPIRRYKE